jgi:preprotein translocase subunit SecA
MAELLNRVLRVGEGRKLKELTGVARAANALEDDAAALDDAGLRGRFDELRGEVQERLASGEDVAAVLREVEPETFALVREASRRSLGMRPFDVQLMGGGALHRG